MLKLCPNGGEMMPLWEYIGLWYIVVSLGMGIAAFNKWPKEKWEEEQNRKSKEDSKRSSMT